MKLPEHRYYTLEKAAKTVGCNVSDLIHFAAIGVLQICIKMPMIDFFFNLKDKGEEDADPELLKVESTSILLINEVELQQEKTNKDKIPDIHWLRFSYKSDYFSITERYEVNKREKDIEEWSGMLAIPQEFIEHEEQELSLWDDWDISICELYCLNILTSSPSWIEYWHRRDGKALSTFAVQVLTNERQEAFDDWGIYRSPAQPDKYTVINTVRNSSTVKEYQRLGWVCESAHELSLLVKNDAEFSRLMGRLGYVKIRTRKITGRKEAFWIYRSAEKGLSAAEKQPLMDASYSDVVKRISRGKQEVCPEGAAPHKASEPFVQVSHKPRYGYNEVAVDGKLLHVYGDHIRLLTKKRVRVNGKQVQGYTAKGLRVEVVG